LAFCKKRKIKLDNKQLICYNLLIKGKEKKKMMAFLSITYVLVALGFYWMVDDLDLHKYAWVYAIILAVIGLAVCLVAKRILILY
jgi:drug/metabolite transporter superfamily protein YnfA